MKPNDHFSYVKNNRVSQDTTNIIRLYLPIIGGEAANLYLYCLAFWDNGHSSYHFAQILNHLNMGMENLKISLNRLTAMGLLDLYQTENGYLLKLSSCLSTEEFLGHHVYKRLLEKKIGDAAVERLQMQEPQGEILSRKLSEVFDAKENVEIIPNRKNDFDLTNFKQRMAQENLRFSDEKEDLLVLFSIAEEKNWTWYETYILARETAVSHVISTKRMRQKLEQRPIKGDFTQQEELIIREAKSKTPIVFLAEIKKGLQANVTRTERQLLTELFDLGLLDEVINVVLLLTFNKVNSANLNEKYAMKVANDFAYQKVRTAEEAILKVREHNQQSSKKPLRDKAAAKSNVPEWSNPDYKNETSPEHRAELEEQKRRLLAKLEQGGDEDGKNRTDSGSERPVS